MSFETPNRWLALTILGVFVGTAQGAGRAAPGAQQAQQAELTRKVKSKVAPTYPEIAKRMSISGVVKLAIVVAPNGNVKSTKVIGGHPLLAAAAEEAVKKWKFETAAEESTGIIEITFKPEY